MKNLLTPLLRPFTANVFFFFFFSVRFLHGLSNFHYHKSFSRQSVLLCMIDVFGFWSILTLQKKKHIYLQFLALLQGIIFFKLSLRLVVFFCHELLINYSRYCLSSVSHQALFTVLLNELVLELLLGTNPQIPHSPHVSPLYFCHHVL